MCAFRRRPGMALATGAVVGSAAARSSNARDESSILKQNLAQSDAENAQYRAQIQDLRNQLFQRDQRISALEEQIKEKNSKIEELRIEIVKTQSLQTAHEAQKDSARAATDERTAVLAELRARIQVLEAEKAALVVSANQARSIGGSSTVTSLDSLEQDFRHTRLDSPQSPTSDSGQRAQKILNFCQMLSSAIDDHADLDELVPYVSAIKKQALGIRAG
ncbi:hypothetical protein BDY24DRAFT_417288 [Mrakia frigida]|uniref:uncharacterized protein n=1 Tax=Mrakia frigida TaxID=29902 RepID=UPI003FCBEFE0